MYAGSLGINPGDYLNPDGSVSIGLLPTSGSINDGVTASGFGTSKLTSSTYISAGGTLSIPQTSTSCASNCQGGLTSTPYTTGTATAFTPASAPEFNLMGDSVDTNSVQDWVSASSGTGSPAVLTIPVGIFGVADVSTMLNTIGGLTTGGTICTSNNGLNAGVGCTNTDSYAYITLNFSATSGGPIVATETFALMNGVTQANILDGATAGTSGSTSDYNVTYLGQTYTVDTGQVFSSVISGGTNANDTLVLDSQEFPVFEPLQALDLASISVTDVGSANPGTSNHEVLSAVTITPTPEPSTILLLGAGLAVIGVTRFPRKSVKA